ncbi:MAG: CinA family nicotinamide mononucleotide deamidase-related protein [Actinomycetota bacterium]
MKAAVVSVLTIGDELLSGEVADANLPFIAGELSPLGIRVARHVTVRDDYDEIIPEVRALTASSDLLFITGGLGPTSDDLTCEAVGRATDRELVFHQHLADNLEKFFSGLGREMSPENLKQAYLPRGSTEIPATGTAPGFMLEEQGCLVVVLPGVPREVEHMMRSAVMPLMKERFSSGEVYLTRRLMTFGVGESDVAGLLSDRIGAGPVTYGFLVQMGAIVVKLNAAAGDREAASRLLDKEEKEARSRLGILVFGADGESMEEVVGRMLRERGLRVAFAESLTAGMAAARMANVAGSSDYLRGGVVAYTADAKRDLLDVPAGLLAGGAVSTAVAEAMASGVRLRFHSDLGVSTTGVAGPGPGDGDRQPGTVCLALADSEGVKSWEVRLPGDRVLIRHIATLAALNVIRLHLEV